MIKVKNIYLRVFLKKKIKEVHEEICDGVRRNSLQTFLNLFSNMNNIIIKII